VNIYNAFIRCICLVIFFQTKVEYNDKYMSVNIQNFAYHSRRAAGIPVSQVSARIPDTVTEDFREISGSHGDEFEHDCLLGCCAVYFRFRGQFLQDYSAQHPRRQSSSRTSVVFLSPSWRWWDSALREVTGHDRFHIPFDSSFTVNLNLNAMDKKHLNITIKFLKNESVYRTSFSFEPFAYCPCSVIQVLNTVTAHYHISFISSQTASYLIKFYAEKRISYVCARYLKP
jgi:hypothetical protein